MFVCSPLGLLRFEEDSPKQEAELLLSPFSLQPVSSRDSECNISKSSSSSAVSRDVRVGRGTLSPPTSKHWAFCICQSFTPNFLRRVVRMLTENSEAILVRTGQPAWNRAVMFSEWRQRVSPISHSCLVQETVPTDDHYCANGVDRSVGYYCYCMSMLLFFFVHLRVMLFVISKVFQMIPFLFL